MKNVNVRNRKQGGFVLTAELVLIVTILVLGAIVGMVSMRDALNAEMEDVAEAVGSLDQGYQFQGIVNDHLTATIAGSSFTDEIDTEAGDGQGFYFTTSDGLESTTGTVATGLDAANADVDLTAAQ